MKRQRTFRFWISLLMAVWLTSCALPVATPTPFVFPTPNQAQTLTAVFQLPPTATQIPPATQQSETQAVTPTLSGTASATVSPTAGGCTNIAQLISETVVDYSYQAPGTAFTKTWTFKNVGTCTWGVGYSLAFDSGVQMGGASSVPITTTTAPNATLPVTVNLTAPSTLGTHQGFWKLLTPQNTKMDIKYSAVDSTIKDSANDLFWVMVNTIIVTPAPVCNAKDKRPDANGPMIEAYYAGGWAPVIDGDLSDWDDPLLDTANHNVFGTADGDTATFTLKWDPVYLYVAARIVDDNYVQETSGGSNLYMGDSLEILLDTNLKGDYCNGYLDDDDYQLGINGGFLVGGPGVGHGPTMYLFFPSSQARQLALNWLDISPAQVAGPAGYTMEFRISWNAFKIAPAGSEKYGFAFSVSDNDTSGSAKQERMISSAPKRVLTNPTTWQTLQIEIKTGP